MVWIRRAYGYANSMTSIQLGLQTNGNRISCLSSAAGSHKKETVKTGISRCVERFNNSTLVYINPLWKLGSRKTNLMEEAYLLYLGPLLGLVICFLVEIKLL